MLREELTKHTAELTEQTRLLRELVDRPKDRTLELLTAAGPIISGILIAAVGWYFTSTYNRQQIDVAQIQLLEKFNTELLSTRPEERRAALAAVMSLGNEGMAIRTAASLPSDDRDALLSDVFNTGITTQDYDVLRRSLRIIRPMQVRPDSYGRLPLEIAVDNDDPAMLEFLLTQRFEPNLAYGTRATALIKASELGREVLAIVVDQAPGAGSG